VTTLKEEEKSRQKRMAKTKGDLENIEKDMQRMENMENEGDIARDLQVASEAIENATDREIELKAQLADNEALINAEKMIAYSA